MKSFRYSGGKVQLPKVSVKNKTDPYAKRESDKYSNPIASREFILDLLGNSPGPLTYKQLLKALAIESKEGEEALRRRLSAMERDGQIHRNRRKAYARIDKLDLIPGRVQGHRDGYGFLIPTDGSDDIYLSSRQMRKVFDGDEVLVRLSTAENRDRRDGVIVEVVNHNTEKLVGRYFKEQNIGFVRPENVRQAHDVLVEPKHIMGARHNQFVMVEITQQPSRDALPMGRIVEVLGESAAPGIEIDVAIRAHDIPHQWPQSVDAEVAKLSDAVAETDKLKRVNLRHLPLVTIDGEDARDFDDAVFCEKKKTGGWRLFVAIADVSHYVHLGSALDREAERRGTSVYFPDFVLPMLPEILSNGLCSLNPEVDRLAIVCEITISASGRISGFQFYEAVIYSHARLTYTQVGEILAARSDQRSAIRQQYATLSPHLDELCNLYQVLRQMRQARGAIEFETTETRILFDDQRKIERIVPVVRNDAHKLIEECMLCANVCAARFLDKHRLHGLYRVHEGPKEQKLENLRIFLKELGLSLRVKGKPEPTHYQSLLAGIKNRPDAKTIQTVLLRSLAQAMYQPENDGHFGLAYPAYAHFTSPIRRYPDLLVHRAIRHVIRSRQASSNVRRVKGAGPIPKREIYPYTLEDMLRFGKHSSMTERRADEATRDVVNWLKCEYLQNRVGETYQGTITGVTNFGVFVELSDLYVEGLVHVTALPTDYYHYEASLHRLVGERTRRTFRLGDDVCVQVAGVKLDERKVDFDLIETTAGKKRELISGESHVKQTKKSGQPSIKNRPGKSNIRSGKAVVNQPGVKKRTAKAAKKRRGK